MSRSPILLAPVYKLLRSLGLESRATMSDYEFGKILCDRLHQRTLLNEKEKLLDLTDAIDRFRGPLVGLIASWGASPVDAWELAQESLADAYLKRGNCRGDWQEPEIFGRWLRGIARNNYRNWRRARKRRETRVALMDHQAIEQMALTQSHAAIDPRIVELRAAIERLPTRQREVIMMHYIEETSVIDVAALLSLPAKTVEGRLFQARRALRRQLGATSSTTIIKALML